MTPTPDLHVSQHAIERFRERVADLSDQAIDNSISRKD